MKTLVTLALLLFFTLVSRLSYAHLNDHSYKSCFAMSRDVEKIQCAETLLPHSLYISKTTRADETPDEILCVEEEDQDEINKPVSSSRYLIAFYYAFLLDDRNSVVTNDLPGYRPLFLNLSCKYITQRVLRI